MTIQQRLSKEELARRGPAIYEKLRPQLEPTHQGQIVAIDVVSGEFEIANQTLDAADQLHARYPDAQIWFVRVGHRAVHRFGFARSLATTSKTTTSWPRCTMPLYSLANESFRYDQNSTANPGTRS